MAAKRQREGKEVPHFLPDPALDLKPALGVCKGCSAGIVLRIWNHQTGGKELPEPLSACFGERPICVAAVRRAAA
jgi:hypothetical protein